MVREMLINSVYFDYNGVDIVNEENIDMTFSIITKELKNAENMFNTQIMDKPRRELDMIVYIYTIKLLCEKTIQPIMNETKNKEFLEGLMITLDEALKNTERVEIRIKDDTAKI